MDSAKEPQDVEKELKEKILTELRGLGDGYNWVNEDFGTLMENRVISNKLKKACSDRCQRVYE